MRHFVFGMLLYACLLVISLTEFAYKPIVFTAFIPFVLLFHYLRVRATINRKFTGQLQIRSQRKSVSAMTVVLVGLWALLAVIEGREQMYFAAIFGAILVSELLEDFLYKKEKPVTLIIDGNELIVNSVWIIRRNVETLTRVKLNNFTNNLVCSFTENSSITIKYSDYKKENIDILIDTLRSKSQYSVEVSSNLALNSR
jgi:TRAP-type uncharacterized transport system fused permease subunit